MTRLNRKNSAIDQAEIALDKTKVEKRSKLATKKSDFQSDDLEKVDEGDLVSKIIQQGNSKQDSPQSPFDSEEEEDPLPAPEVDTTTRKVDESLDTATIQVIVDRVTNNISETLQTLIVSDRIVAAERNTQDWKRVCTLMANNPELINSRMLTGETPMDAFRQVGADLTDLTKVTMNQFMITPISYPIWKILIHFGLTQNDPCLKKWWARVLGENKGDVQARLFKYLQAITYFHSVSDQFWSQMSVNPTFYTVEGIVIRLTTMGDWLRAGAMDFYGWADKFYLLAKSIAQDEPKGNLIFKTLENVWPANLKGNLIHYDSSPFSKTEFIVNEGQEQVVISPPLKMYKFNPEKVWRELEDSQVLEPSTSKAKPEVSKKRKLNQNSPFPDTLEPIDSDDGGQVPFAMLAADSDYLLD